MNSCTTETKKKKRQTQNDTLRLLQDVRPQFMVGLNQTFKRMRRDTTHVTVARHHRREGSALPLEPKHPLVYPLYIAPHPVQTLPDREREQSQSYRQQEEISFRTRWTERDIQQQSFQSRSKFCSIDDTAVQETPQRRTTLIHSLHRRVRERHRGIIERQQQRHREAFYHQKK
ncbi:hypothetical protein PROFUN_06208 [Planoprotostelium fungivorum]|uniref:Uncharacterized protein n=1 Tax=Planoprotostelium fungivorum TaxID=1890364 RepID=A0A2P6MYZ9_9EUKA|nr:hypothetical protein PROFUN_06208 [Planoprotostelium fungivorum]